MPPDPPAPDEHADTETGRIRSLEEQDRRIGGLEEKIDKLLGIASGGGKPDGEPGQRQPANVAEEIRAQLEERDRKTAAAAEDRAKTDRLAAVETKLAELAEKPPVTPPRRVEKLMGWR